MLSRSHRLLVCAAVLVLAASACKAKPEDKPLTLPSKPVVHPLTGVPAKGNDAWQSRPVLALKLGNAPRERPQAGLDKADLVYEELVEGGATRFMAIFSTEGADRVGPIRSARKVDPTLLAPLGALFGYSGGAPSTIRVIQSSSGFTDVGINKEPNAYHRDRSRSSPYNLFTSTDALWSGNEGSPPPEEQFKFLGEGSDASLGSQETAASFSLSFANGGSLLRYVYDSGTGRYGRFIGENAHMAEGQTPVTFRNIVVQSVKISAGYSIDKAGFRTNDIATTGSGAVIVFRGGKAFRGHWERSSNSERTKFLTDTGREIALAPGNTLIELLPEGRTVSVSS